MCFAPERARSQRQEHTQPTTNLPLNTTHHNSQQLTPTLKKQIATEVDADPRAGYFRQARSGLHVRMALLKLCLLGQ